MALRYACQHCDEEMLLRPTHRGDTVQCPACDAETEVPSGIAFRALTDAAVADRRRGHRVLMFALVACVVWLPPLAAFLWWYSAGLSKNAKLQGRDEVEEVRSARILSALATVAQLLFYLHLALGGKQATGPLGWYWSL